MVVGDNGTILQSDSAIIPTLTGANFPAQNSIQLSLSGEVGREYRIQAADDLILGDWKDLFVFTNTSPMMQFLDPTASPQRFYRAVTP